MERRSLLAGLVVVVLGSLLLAGSASARTVTGKKPSVGEPPTCIIASLPSFVAQGEFGEASSVADVVEVSCTPEFGFQTVKLSDEELFSRCKGKTSWSEAPEFEPTEGATTKIKLDGEGNGSAVVWGGPGCAAGETLVSAHLEVPPFTTVTTGFEVLPPKTTPPGVYALPATSVEDNVLSSVETIVEVEFPSVFAEQDVNISAEQLFARCGVAPKVEWIGPDEKVLAVDEEGISKVKLDDNGNAFVVLFGGPSCASGVSEIEASLESAPFTTFTTDFTVKAPEAGL
jgi:hypothetical protein